MRAVVRNVFFGLGDGQIVGKITGFFGVKKGQKTRFSKIDFFPTICPSICAFLGGRCGDLRRDPPKRGPCSRFWRFFPYYLPVVFLPTICPSFLRFSGGGRKKGGGTGQKGSKRVKKGQKGSKKGKKGPLGPKKGVFP